MSLFPQNMSFDDESRYLQGMMEDTYRDSISLNLNFWAEADLDARFKAGDQQLWNDLYGQQANVRRKQLQFNRIRRVVNMITGYQRQHRKSLQVIPRESEDQQTADQFTKLLYWAETVADTQEKISEAFESAVTTGMSLLHSWWDYREDPINGTPRLDVLHYNDFLIDPFFRQKDLSDCRFIWSRKWMNKEDILSLNPSADDLLGEITPHGWTTDGKFNYQPEAYNTGSQNLFTYDEYYYRTYKPSTVLVDRRSGDTLEWKGNKEQLKLYLQRFPWVAPIERNVPCVKVGVVVNGIKLFHGNVPTGNEYPHVGVFGYYDPQIPLYSNRCQGVVRNLRDSQYLYNRRKIIELDMLESTATTGYKYKANALVDPKSIFLTGQGRGIAIKDDANLADVEPLQPPQIPPSMLELSKSLSDEIQQISGVNEELLGSAEDDKAGILSMLRQGAGLTTLQVFFDQLDSSIKRLGTLQVKGFQHNFTFGKVQRIINEQPSPQFYDRYFAEYDCLVEEASITTTQKQLQFKQMLYLRELGIPIPTSELIRTMQMSGKNELIEAIQQSEQQQQELESFQAEQQGKVQEATLQNLLSQASYYQAGAAERVSRVEENSSLAIKREAESEREAAAAAYDEVKALKELETLDLDYVEKGLKIIQALKATNEPSELVGGR